MTLLAPGAMLLAAALAVPLLAAFYLLKLRRKPMRVTSTMLWTQAARDLEVNVPFQWIRPSWLLVLHTLILLALLVAIGRPAIADGGAGTGRVFLLIDRSASMNVPTEVDGPTRLDAARSAARGLVERFADSRLPPEFTVIAYAAEPVIMAPPSRDAGTVGAMINAIEPTDQPADPRGAIDLVRSLTTTTAPPPDAETDDQAAPPLTVLVTDDGDLARSLPGSGTMPIRVRAVGAAGQTPANIGITGFAADREIGTPAFVRIFLRLVNTAPSGATVPVVVRLDGEPIARRPITIPGGGATPGEQAESLRLSIPEGGVLSVSIERDDALAADNTVFGVLPPVRRPAVLLVVPDALRADEPMDPRRRTDPILLDVLEAIGTAGLRVVDLRQYAANTDGLADRFGLVVFDRVRPALQPPIPSLSFGVPMPGVPARFVRAADRGRTGVLAWDRNHPVMRDAVLDTIVVGDRLVYPEDDAAIGDSPDESDDASRATLARGNTGPLIVAFDDNGTRRVAVGFSLDRSNWPVHFSFPIFILSVFDHLVPGADGAAWRETGETVTVDAPPRATSVSLTGPDTRSIPLDADRTGRRVPLGFLEKTGLYTITAGGSETKLAVNLLSPSESRITARPTADDDGTGAAIGGTADDAREVWRWFVLAAGIGLLLEWAVFTMRSRA